MHSNGMPAPRASGPGGVADRLLRNTIANIVGRFWAIGINLVLTPYIVNRVGLERFGLWSLISVLTGYVALLDLGLGIAFVKRLSEYRARGDWKRLNDAVTTGLVTQLAVGIVAGAAALVFAGLLARLLDVPPALAREGRIVLGWGLVLFALGNAASVFPSVVVSFQRMDLSNRIAIAATIPQAIGTVIALETGHGLIGLLVVQAAVTAFFVLANAVAAWRLCPSLRISVRHVSGHAYRDLMSFGMKLQAVKAADVITFQTDRLLVARFVGMGAVGLYQLGTVVAGKVRQMPLLLTSAVLPLASELSVQGERTRLLDLYERGTRYLTMTGLPLSALVAVLARPFFRAWMGQGYDSSATILQILAAGYFANLLHGQAVLIGAAVDRPGLHTRSASLTAVLNLVLCLVLVRPYGAVGVAAATTVSLLMGPVYYLPMFHRLLSVPLVPFLKRLLTVPLLGTAAASVAAVLASRAAAGVPFAATRLQGIAEVAAGTTAFGIVYFLVLWRLRYLTGDDLSLARRVLRFGLRAPANLVGAEGGR